MNTMTKQHIKLYDIYENTDLLTNEPYAVSDARIELLKSQGAVVIENENGVGKIYLHPMQEFHN